MIRTFPHFTRASTQMTEKTIVKVAMNGQGVLSRRGFLRGVGLGAAGLSAVSFTDLMALQADELRQRQMSCILLWMAGGPSQFETFDPKPGHENGGETKAIETAVPGIQIAEQLGADRQGDEGHRPDPLDDQQGRQPPRATYQLHTGYIPSGSVKHPTFGCVTASELGDPKFDLPHFVSIGGPTVGAGFLGASFEPFTIQNPLQPPSNVTLPGRREPLLEATGPARGAGEVGFAQSGGADASATTRPSTGRRPAWSSAPDEGLRPGGRGPRAPRGLRPEPVRPGLPAGPPAGRDGRDVRRGPHERLGHAQAD